jgi:hypothetical protein
MAEQPLSSDHEAASVLSAPAQRAPAEMPRARRGRGLASLLSGSPFCSPPGLSSSSSLRNGTAGSGYRFGRSRMTRMFAATSRR